VGEALLQPPRSPWSCGGTESGGTRTSGPSIFLGLGLFCGSNPSASRTLDLAGERRWMAGGVRATLRGLSIVVLREHRQKTSTGS